VGGGNCRTCGPKRRHMIEFDRLRAPRRRIRSLARRRAPVSSCGRRQGRLPAPGASGVLLGHLEDHDSRRAALASTRIREGRGERTESSRVSPSLSSNPLGAAETPASPRARAGLLSRRDMSRVPLTPVPPARRVPEESPFLSAMPSAPCRARPAPVLLAPTSTVSSGSPLPRSGVLASHPWPAWTRR